ncbi:MAG: hypothetical protein GC178_16575 [Flavobacteriales bacterium]|nr:hypothetical protein [Flavobacteriales bacterium]
MTGEELTMAIYPNALGFGYAVVRNPREPIDCGVVKFDRLTNVKCIDRITILMDKYMPQQVIIQQLQGKFSNKSKRVTQLLKAIVHLAESNDAEVYMYTREQIRFVFGEFDSEAQSKHRIALLIADYLPQFKYRVPKYRKAWMAEDYNMGLFDALSLIITHFYLTE